jgi:LCP family protein required for cell wall assembly
VRQHRTSTSLPRSLPIAALLSFIWPGLGQWYDGRPRRALIFAAPVVAVAVAGAAILGTVAETAALRLLNPSLAILVVWAVALVGVWRLIALVEPLAVRGDPRKIERRSLAVVALLAALVVATHAWVGSVGWSFYEAGTAIFEALPSPTPGPTIAPGSTPSPSPIETPFNAQARINVLLIGVDSSPTRTHALTDTLIVASVDPVTGATSMVSFPRDLARFPMYNGGEYDGKINSLLNWAANHPGRYPEGGVGTLMQEVGFLLGIPIDYYASINLNGFVQLIDAMDYVTVDNPRDITDPVYGGWTDGRPIGFYLTKGVHRLDGQEALAYARSRKGAGDNDFTRAARQQQLLQAVRQRLTDPTLLPRLPAILQAIAATLRTNFPQDRLVDMLELAKRVDDSATKKYVLGPPYSTHPPDSTTGGTYILLLNEAKVRALSVQLFGPDSAFWTAPGSPAPSLVPSASGP